MARSGELVLPMGDAPLLVPLVTAEPPTSDGGEASVVVEICEARVHVNGRPGASALTGWATGNSTEHHLIYLMLAWMSTEWVDRWEGKR